MSRTIQGAYKINGFRSLLCFSIEIRQGINVLVGPNGSGKTNFIEFLDFLDDLYRYGASTAVSNAGGVARVFSQENMQKASPSLSTTISGIANIEEFNFNSKSVNTLFQFEYSLEVKFSKSHAAIFISKETLRMRKLHNIGEAMVAGITVGSINLNRKSPTPGIPPTWQIGPRLLTRNERNPLSVLSPLRSNAKVPIQELFETIVLAPDESLLSARPRFPAIEAVRDVITRGRSFNIIPDRARTPDDIIKPPGIMKDGSGLSSTLHFLQSIKTQKPGRPNVRMRRAGPETIDMIIEWTKLVYPSLKGISISQDPMSGKYMGYFLIGEADTLRISLQSASDGTLKWLSLVCLILGSGGIFCLEEPENYLHPKMQQFLVKIIRESLDDNRQGFFLFSTHSETLIHECLPDELIIFTFDEGGTTCKRLDEPDRVDDEINRTGFGLGYYYANNTLS